MAKQDEQDVDTALAILELAKALGAQQARQQSVLEQLMANTPIKQIGEADPEYVERLKREGFHDTFPKPVYQNQREAQARGLSVEIRERASGLKSGKYLKGRVTVEATDTGVWLSYPTKGDEMMKNQQFWRDFPDLITQIWNEMHAAVPA